LRKGDQDAFTVLVDRCHTRFTRFARSDLMALYQRRRDDDGDAMWGDAM
jgi:hypothetical protein